MSHTVIACYALSCMLHITPYATGAIQKQTMIISYKRLNNIET